MEPSGPWGDNSNSDVEVQHGVQLSEAERPWWGPPEQFRCGILICGCAEWSRVTVGKYTRAIQIGILACGLSYVKPSDPCEVHKGNSELESQHGGGLRGAE